MNPSRFEVFEDQSIRWMRFRLPPFLDPMEIDTLMSAVLRAIAPDVHRPWALDLAEVEYMGSSMLGLMVNIRERIRQGGGRLILCSLSPRLFRTFENCCLERLFAFARTRDEAVIWLTRQ